MEKEESACLVNNRKGYVRYVVAFMLLCGVLLNYVVKVMLSVAIVAMVKHHSSSNSTNGTNDEDTCPGGIDDDSDNIEDGPFDWDEEEQGEILSSYFYGYVATQFLGGWMADNIGARWLFGPGLLLTGVFSVLSPMAANIDRYVLMVLRALQGVGSGVLLPSANVFISKWFTLEERPRIASFVLSANFGGTLISMGVSGVLIDTLGWSSVFYIYGGGCILYAIPYSYFVYSTPEDHPRISSWEREHIARGRRVDNSETDGEKQELEQRPQFTPWVSILMSGPLWAIVGVHCGLSWLNYTLMTQLPTYITNILHFSLQKSGFISALPYLFGWIFAALFGSLSSWLRTSGRLTQMNAYRIFTGIANVGAALFLLLVALLGCNTVAIIVCFIATVVAVCAFYGGAITQHLDLAPNFSGATTGILYTCVNLPGILAPQVAGIILKGQNSMSGWHIVFYISMAASITPYIFYLLFATDKEQSWNRTRTVETRTEISVNGPDT